ncbi:hypothetical protein HNP84_006533 [Thermocatellispora tengchongensis]|uniref:DUF2812 domain-containing protein n=1 Tax=Thermocatellispora tengchongensis TaxID=1073253 RepID=A0A840PC08_9ACTN|nr:hypothetical protein [Thermocatellispora tengchongensis]MBB5136782.1 hypothetical protein [Thermocatellispora tengchongensis]
MSDYFDELARLLREAGVPRERVDATVGDLAAYVAESGTAPEEEFGPAAAFARTLGAGAAPAESAESASEGGRWVWTADIFIDEQRLNEFGAQGWEVETVDKRGMFVSRRDAERPQRWEYRREVVGREGRRALAERLAPDGWEPCGSWVHYEYFKRPAAASVGPAAEITAPPPAPAARMFLSRRFYALAAALFAVIAAVVAGVGVVLTAVTPIKGAHFWTGAAIGALAALGALWLMLRRLR